MKTWLLHLWNRLRTSFWFVPGGMVVLSLAAAYGAVWIDQREAFLPDGIGLEKVSPDGLRSLLSTAATAVLTLAGLTFSATLVALTLASSQFGGRILRNFIRSLPNQVALGMLLANFVFCLVVLRHVQSAEEGSFVPQFATLVAFLATLVSLAAFIYFIHHISVSLQADRVVASIHQELDETLERFFPDRLPDDPEERRANADKEDWEALEDEWPVEAPTAGYVQALNMGGLVEICRDNDLRCRVLHRPGQFVHAGGDLLAVEGGSGGDLRERLADQVLIGRIRTAEQDFEFCLRQLVEVALRALSPGINDPFTALNCIDYLGAALAKVATRSLPRRTFRDGDGHPRVRTRPSTFADLLGAAFHQLRQAAASRPDVAIRLLDALARIAARTRIEAHREAIRTHVDAVLNEASACSDCDRADIDEAARRVTGVLDEREDRGSE